VHRSYFSVSEVPPRGERERERERGERERERERETLIELAL
jgi:hypothetical protein